MIRTTSLDLNLDLPNLSFTPLERGLAKVGLYGLACWRMKRRLTFEYHRAYMAATVKNRITKGWGSIGVSANRVAKADAKSARELVNWLVLNDSYGRRISDMLVGNVVSDGIKTQCQVKFSRNNRETNERQNGKIEDLKYRWMEQADATGQLHWFDMQDLALRRTIETGGSLCHTRYLTDPGRVLPLAYQLYEVERLTDWRAEPMAGNTVEQGVELDADGRAVAYHIAEGEYSLKTKRIPAEQMKHVFRIDRPGQVRGITWYAPVIADLHMLRDVKEFALIARKVQSAIAVLVADNPKGIGLPPGTPGLNPEDQANAANATNDPVRAIEPGMIMRTGTGTVTSHAPPQSNDLDPLSTLILRGIGIGVGLSYEWVAGDYNKTSHAGGRLANQEPRRRAKSAHAWFTRKLDGPVHREFIDIAGAMGKLPMIPARADKYSVRFSSPHWEWGVNPWQEVNASAKAMESSISTIRDEVEARGGDWQDFMRQVAQEIQFGDQLGLNVHPNLRIAAQGAGDGTDVPGDQGANGDG